MFILNFRIKLKMNLFYKYAHKNRVNFFSNNKLKFTLDHRILKSEYVW